MTNSNTMEVETKSEGKYKYEGMKLMPAIFGEIMVDLFDGKQFERADCIKKVLAHHNNKGGVIKGVNGVACFKKASQRLQEQGIIKSRGYGVWQIDSTGKKEIEVVIQKKEETMDYSADKIIGDGKEEVYIYYFEAYQQLAKTRGVDVFPCKIGRTEKGALNRIFEQSGTSLPEKPHIGLIIRCENSYKLEHTLHSIMKLHKRGVEKTIGKEWFRTSPTEVEEIYNKIVGMLRHLEGKNGKLG